ncbi:MAG: polysaccharide biosynthesis tyrosine autokinase [Acidobacteria bacterium]|nr:polysaccharide biosynthesis tyrosine autokinase [Acidobacteriota bacterium]
MADERHHLDKFTPSDESALVRASDAGRRYPDYAYIPSDLDDGPMAVVREQWRRIIKHKWLIAVVALVITTVVSIEAFRSKSIYRATTVVELDKGSRTIYKTNLMTIESDDADIPYVNNIAVKTNIRLLKSRPILEDIILALKLNENARFLDVTGRKSIVESLRTIQSRVFNPSSPAMGPGLAPPPPMELEEPSQRSQQESLRLAPYVGVLSAYLVAEQVEDTRMLAISFDHTDANLAATIVNSTAQIFMQRAFQNRVRRFETTSDWLSTRTRELRAQVEEAELELAGFAGRHNMMSTGEGKESLTTDKLANLYGQVLKSEMDMILKESLYEEVRQGRVTQLPEAFGDAKLNAIKTRLDELTVQATQNAGRFGPENPRVQALNREIETLKKQHDEGRALLESRLKAEYDRAAREQRAIRDAFERAKGEAVAQNSAVIQYGMLKQKVDIAKSIYQEFLSKTTQTDLQKHEQQYSSARIIEPAFVPGSPIGPNRIRTILIGFAASLVLGVALALGLEYLDNTVKTADDVSRTTALPTLGLIPAMTGKRRRFKNGDNGKSRQLLLTEQGAEPERALPARFGRRRRGYSTNSLAEAYRGLRTSILLSSAGHAPKTMLITSSQPSEGKTTTTINTGISLAQLGASVLVIDADMRRPAAHRALRVNQSPGLSTYLSSDARLEGLVQELSIPHMSLLSCGPVPPNPAELLSSPRMKELLREASEKYDHVLVDSPPLMNVSDSLILATLVEGVVLVVQGGRSSRGIVRRARMELGNIGAKIFGVVLNNVDLKRDGYDGYYYYNRYYGSEYGADSGGERAGTGGD